jgi:hypothetical protein
VKPTTRHAVPRACALGCVVALGLALATPAAHADELSPGDLDRLRKRFREAIALEQDEHWAEALALFEQVAKAKPSPQVRFHVALCQEQVGQLAKALAGFREALVLAKKEPATAADVLQKAPTRIEELARRVPTIAITIEGELSSAVVLDGVTLTSAKLDAPIEVDPGLHRVTTVKGVEEKLVGELVVKEGERAELTVKGDPPAESTLATPPPPPAVEPGDTSPAWIVGGVGVAALAGAGAMFGMRQWTIAQVEATCSGNDGLSGCDPGLRGLADDGRTYETMSLVLAGAGVAALGTAAALWFTVGADRPLDPAATTALSVGVGPSGLMLRGRF